MDVVKSFGSFSVKDVEPAADFYRQKLGLEANIDEKMGVLEIKLPGGSSFMLYPKGDQHEPASYTVLNLLVVDLEKSVDELTEKGVEFEHYDNEYMKTDEKGISQTGEDGPGIAWFKDLDGNILSLIENQ